MTIRVGINGFGRIGRLVFRAGIVRDDIEIVAVNAPDKTPEQLAYATKYDSVHGKFDGSVEIVDGNLVVNGKNVKLLNSRDPSKLPWGELGVDYVLECTGKFLTKESAQPHLDAGAKVVVLSGPSKDDTPMFVCGVNLDKYDTSMTVVSNASCTTNCLAPVCKVLQDKFGIKEGLMNTIHAYTNDQKTLDFPHKNYSRGRAAALSIIPTSTGAAKAISEVMPELKGKLNGFALRVPTPDVSVVDLTVVLEKPATVDEVNAAMKEAAAGSLKGILEYEPEDLVSMDFVGDTHSSIFAPMHTMAMGDRMIKLLSWYDNECGYSNRVIDLANYIFKKGL